MTAAERAEETSPEVLWDVADGAGSAVVERIDHVAVEVRDFDDMVARLERSLGLRCTRIGRLTRDPSRRIAVVRDAAGFTLEIIEAPVFHRGAPTLDHIAFRVRDVAPAHDALVAQGFQSRITPRRLDPSRGENAVLTDPTGLVVQVVRYDTDPSDR